MAQIKMVALTTPLPGKEGEFNDWYQNAHLPELVNGLSMQGAQRYKLVAKMAGADENQYLAIYDIEADDPGAFLAQMGEFAGSGQMTPPTTQDMATTYLGVFVEHGERVTPG